MLQLRIEFLNPPIKQNQEMLKFIQKKLGQQVQYNEYQVVEKILIRDGHTVNNNKIIFRIVDNQKYTCEHLLIEQDNNLNFVEYQENISSDCSILFERVGFKLKQREEYQEIDYFIKFMNCHIILQDSKNTKKIILLLRDDQGMESRLIYLGKLMEKQLKQGGFI